MTEKIIFLFNRNIKRKVKEMRKILFYVLLVTCSVRLVYGATGTSRLFSTGKDNVFEIGSDLLFF